MAEQNFDINIRTTADTKGIKETEAALSGLSKEVEAQLAAAGARYDPATGSFVSITQEAGKATEEAAKQAGHFGVNLGKARAEAIILARELASGVPTTRTLSSLLGSLGLPIAAAATVGLALNRAINAVAEEINRTNRELDAQLTSLTKNAQKWDDMARSATSLGDILKVAQTATESVNAEQEKFLKFQNAGLEGWKEWVDAMVKGATLGGSIFGKRFEEEANRLAGNVERIRDARRHAVEDAKATTEAFDEEKLKPFDEAFDDINQKLQEQERLQQQVGTSNIESYIAIGKQIETYKAQLKELINLENQRKREAEETKRSKEEDVEFWQKAIKGASPQVQRILMQEEAARTARTEGRERDVEMFEKSAEAFKRGATPKQLAELAPLENNAGVIQAIKENTAATNRLYDLWR